MDDCVKLLNGSWDKKYLLDIENDLDLDSDLGN